MQQALDHPDALVDMVTDPAALSLPPNITWEVLMGFSTAAKTVLDGGVGRMVDLARANLRNIGGAAAIRQK